MTRLVLFLLLLFTTGAAIASSLPVNKHGVASVKAVTRKDTVLKLDSTDVKARSFNQAKLKSYLSDREFRYSATTAQGRSLWERFWLWFWEWVRKSLFSDEKSRNVVNYGFAVAGVVLLLYLAIRVSGIDVSAVWRGTPQNISIPYSENEITIHRDNFEEEIDRAVSSGNFRLAVRLSYVYALKQLHEAGLISWQIEKTNSIYINEIPQGEKRRLFKLLTYRFEYIWYGNFKVDAAGYQEISSLFKELKSTPR